MKRNYIISKIRISSITPRTGKGREKKILNELQSVVFQDTSKESLVYFLAEELEEKGYMINAIKVRKV